jgi:Mg-chelatase subunit ChlD
MNEGRTDLNAVGDEKMEARIVAWVLGQASTFEAEELEKFCAEYPEWNVYHRRMLALHGLLQEAAAVEASAEWKLEAGRRAKLDQVLGMQQVEGSPVGEKRQGNRTQMWQQIAKSAAAILLITLIVGLSKFSLSKEASRAKIASEIVDFVPGGGGGGGVGHGVGRSESSDASRLSLNPELQSKAEVPSAKKGLELAEADALAESSPLPQPVTSPPPPQVPGKPEAKPAAELALRDSDHKENSPEVAKDDFYRSSYAFEPANGPVATSNFSLPAIESGSIAPADVPASAAAQSKSEVALNKEVIPGVGNGVGYGGAKPEILAERRSGDQPITEGFGIDNGILATPDADPFGNRMGGRGDLDGDERGIDLFSDGAANGRGDLAKGKPATASGDSLGDWSERQQEGNEQLAAAKRPVPGKDMAPSPDTSVAPSGGVVKPSGVADLSDFKADKTAGAFDEVVEEKAKQSDDQLSTYSANMLDTRNDLPVAGQQTNSDQDARFGPNAEGLKGVQAAQKLQEAPREREQNKEVVENLRNEPKAVMPETPMLQNQAPELSAALEPYSTFSLRVSDASFKLAQAAMVKNQRPDPASVRVEEFYNAFDYGDPVPAANEPVACALEQSAHPFLPSRNLVRVSMRTASAGRGAGQALHLTVLIDNSGSMGREDRAAVMEKSVQELTTLLTENDRVSIISFARTPRLVAENIVGNNAAQIRKILTQTPSDGGTNLEEALKLSTQIGTRNQAVGAQNRILLMTDGAANLGDANPDRLTDSVKTMRQGGLAFDIIGIGTDGLNDAMLLELARNGNGRYYVVNSAADAKENFARQLAGAFRPAAENVKVQVRFNPQRVGKYKLIGFEKDRLKTEDFRNDSVDAAELAAAEAGNAIYQVELLPEGSGDIGEVSVRFRDTATKQIVENKWTMNYDASAPAFDRASPSMQVAGLAMMIADKLRGGPLADMVRFAEMTATRDAVRQHYSGTARVAQLLEMVRKLE